MPAIGIDAIVTLVVVAGAMLALARSVAGIDFILLGALGILFVLDIVPAREALIGFSNESVLVVGMLYVVAAGVRETGSLEFIARRLLGRPRKVATAQLRMMAPVIAISAFLNNTPVVAILAPSVQEWAKRNRIGVEKLLMPLSYAAILGGMCTLIGTSSNLVVAGMTQQRDPSVVIDIFDITVLGLPAAAVGLLYVLAMGRRLLPERDVPGDSLQNPREYTVAIFVEQDSAVIGQTIEAAGLRHLPGLYLMQIQRDGRVLPAVGPDEVLQARDVLGFVGVVESVVDLQKIRGLVPATKQVHKLSDPRPERRLVEAVVAGNSALVGRSVRQTGFRTAYDAAIIAVHRGGARVSGKIGDIVLTQGDTLLLEASPRFASEHRYDSNFLLISEVEDSSPPRFEHARLALLILGTMVMVNATGLLPLVKAVSLAAAAMLLTGCVRGRTIRRALDWQVLVAIGAAFGIGAAMEQSGAAAAIAQPIVAVGAPLGAIGVLAGVYFTTAFLTEFMTNVAAAVLMFPVAAEAAEAGGVPLRALALVLMIAASASFATPVGYQTNLMVWGPGGYRFGDFLRFGLPLHVLLALTTLLTAHALLL